MRKPLRSLFTFHGLLWTLTTLVALLLLAYPLARNLYASYTWTKTPCWYSPDLELYFFEHNGIHYFAKAPDFWHGFDLVAGTHGISQNLHPSDSFCYVSSGDPPDAVRFLDAHQHLDHAARRLVITAMLFVVTSFIAWSTRKPAPSPTTTSPPTR